MIRWLLIGLVIYMIYRLIAGPGGKRRQNPFFTFRFGHFPNERQPGSQPPHNRNNSNSKAHLDQIEDAEFEDITEEDIDITDKKN